MPTEKKSRTRRVSAAQVLEGRRKEIISGWIRLFPKERWKKQEASEVSETSLDAIIQYVKTGKTGPVLETIGPVFTIAARKDGVLKSGLTRMASAKAPVFEALLSSEDLDNRSLRKAILRLNRLFDRLVNTAADSVLRTAPAAKELLRRVSFHEGILGNPSLAVFAADSKGKVALWSKGAEKMSGIPAGRIAGRELPPALRDVADGDSREVPEAEVLKAFSLLARRLGMKAAPPGRHLATTVSRVRDDAGVFLGTIGVALDLTRILRAQERLQELGAMIDRSGDAIVQVDTRGIIKYWNSGAVRLTGFSKKEAVGRTVRFYAGRMKPATYSSMMRALKRAERWSGEVTVVRKDGGEVSVMVSLSPLYSPDGSLAGGLMIGTDVSMLRRAQARMEEQARLLEQTREAIVQTDAQETVVFWNKGAEILTGYSREEALGRGSSFLGEVVRHYDREKMLAHFKKDNIFTRELRLVRKDGREILALVSQTALRSPRGVYAGTLGVATDITELRRAQATAEERGELLNKTVDAVVQVDANGNVVFWNRGAERLTGYSSEEMLGKTSALFKSILPDFEQAKLREVMRDNKLFTAELKGIRKNKTEFTCYFSVTPLFSDSGEYAGAVGIGTDVTDLAIARQRIKEQADLMERTRDAIIRSDSQGKMIYWNRGAELLTGYSREEVIDKSYSFFSRLTPEYDREFVLKHVKRGRVLRSELHGTKKNGEEFIALVSMTPLFSSSGEYTGILGVATDVTHLRRTERAVAESQKLLQTILDSIHDLVAVTDQDRNLVYSNKAIERLTGYSFKDYRKVGPPYYTMPETESKLIDSIENRLMSSRAPQTYVLPIPSKDGRERKVEWSSVPIRGEKPGGIRIVSVGREVTQRIKRERESKLLLDLSSSLGKTLDREEVLSEALVKTVEALRADAGLIAEMDHETGSLRLLAEKGLPPGIARRFDARARMTGWSEKVLRTGRPILIKDIGESMYSKLAYPEAMRAGYKSFLSLPLLYEGKSFGLFEMGSLERNRFDETDLNLGLSIAAVISSALHNATLHEQLADRQRSLTELTKRLAMTEEHERTRIAAELHDETGQILAAAKAGLQVASRQLGASSKKVREALRESTELVSRALDQVRDISHGLHPALLDDMGLPGAVRWLAQGTESRTAIRIYTKMKGMDERLPPPMEASIFRIIQEALANVGRHSGASRARVTLDRAKKRIVLTVEDDGVGFRPDAERAKPKGLGLGILRQRARWLGGEMMLKSEPGKGTLLRIEIPAEAYADEEH